MRKLFILAILTLLSVSAFAQLTGSGYYRVRNYGTGCYVWVCDNTGSINYAATSADMGAMQLWKGLDKAISEPASVLYFDNKGGNKWDVRAQSTGIYKIIHHYVDITSTGTSDGLTFYQLSATEAGMTLYLSDVGGWGGDYNVLGTNGKGATRRWIVEPIDASTDSYFGVQPSITVGDKHYAPFYAEFPFSFASAGMKAYVVSKIDGNIAVMKEITSSVIPGATPVLIECSSADKSDNRLNLLTTSSASVSGNLLKGVYFCNEFREKSKDAIKAFDAQTMRVWNVNADGKLVLNTSTDRLHVNWWGDDGNRYLLANQSYLPVSAGTADELVLMTEEEYNNREIPATSISLSATQLNVVIGAQPSQLVATVVPANATNKTVAWSSSDESVASVDQNGLVTFKSVGKAVITAMAQDGSGVKATCSVEVSPVLVSKLTLNVTELELNINEKSTLTATIEPTTATVKLLTWTSSDTSVATVDANGVVTAVAPGSAVITAKATDASGVAATCTVTVLKPLEPEDVSQDGVIDTLDVLGEYQYIMEGSGSVVSLQYDVNRDGKADTQDVLQIYEYMEEH